MDSIYILLMFAGAGIVISNAPYWASIIRWLAVDVWRYFTKPRVIRLYGVWLFCGIWGGGKTVSLSKYLTDQREKYGDKIYICTNYGFSGEDFPLTHWKKLIPEYDKPIIFGYDEMPNEFFSRNYRDFPYDLVKVMTQNRKGNGKQIVGTAINYGDVDKLIRNMCSHVIECKSAWFGRVTKCRKYTKEAYEQYMNEVDVMKKRKIPCIKSKFVQTDALRSSYDSFQFLDSARDKKYISASEKLARMVADKPTS